jgi:hypothetical protein
MSDLPPNAKTDSSLSAVLVAKDGLIRIERDVDVVLNRNGLAKVAHREGAFPFSLHGIGPFLPKSAPWKSTVPLARPNML